MRRPLILSLLLDSGPKRPFDYAVPDHIEGPFHKGLRVQVPFRGKELKGTVVALKEKPEVANVKPITSLLSDEGALSDEQFQLAEWMSHYYVTPLKKVLPLFLPSAVRGKSQAKLQQLVKRTKAPGVLLPLVTELQRTHPSQAKVLSALLKTKDGLLLTELIEQTKVSRSPIATLQKKGLIQIDEVRIDRSPVHEFEFFPTKPKTLTGEQKIALEKILKSQGTFKTHLLHGITGSGKTEVYLQAIDAMLKQGRSVILLIPEIALTAQTIERLKGRFREKIAILHHRLSQGERFDTYHAIKRGEIPIVVGARSALFSPLPNLGMIIVDEEHESSFKQTDEMPCYHARDVAIMRAKLNQCTCLLGSATPSLESYQNALLGKYELTTLKARATKRSLPDVKMIDLLKEIERHKRCPLLSDPLLSAIEEKTAKGEQTLLFLNRRGYNTFLLCAKCEESFKCPHCAISLTFHKGKNQLSCHLCDYTLSPPPRECPKCKSSETLKFCGAGTEQVERQLHAIFPHIRTIRMDADTTRHKGSHDRLFKEFRSGKADVLIGTQMVAKGLHFPSVTLVGVLNTDSALSMPDFRASETVFQLLAQVAGRSGRGMIPGQVMIQTRMVDHPIIQLASKEDYKGFFETELKSREMFQFPPFKRLARFIFKGPVEEHVQAYGHTLYQFLQARLPKEFQFLPLAPCGYAKIKDNYRYHFQIKGPHFLSLSSLDLPEPPKNIRLLIDIDPLTTFL